MARPRNTVLPRAESSKQLRDNCIVFERPFCATSQKLCKFGMRRLAVASSVVLS